MRSLFFHTAVVAAGLANATNRSQYLLEKKPGTLLFNLLAKEEDIHYENRFDADLLTRRLTGATAWLEKFPAAEYCRIGYFGAGTGAASALKADAIMPQQVQ
jgi:putative phosphoribosyl transferase